MMSYFQQFKKEKKQEIGIQTVLLEKQKRLMGSSKLHSSLLVALSFFSSTEKLFNVEGLMKNAKNSFAE